MEFLETYWKMKSFFEILGGASVSATSMSRDLPNSGCLALVLALSLLVLPMHVRPGPHETHVDTASTKPVRHWPRSKVEGTGVQKAFIPAGVISAK